MNQKLKSLIGGNQASAATPGPGRAGMRKNLPDRLAAWIPVALLVGFFLLLWILFGSRLLPARNVVVETVVTLRGDGPDAPEVQRDAPASATTHFDGPTLFQASGWIEPDPLPIRASALEGGIVDQVFVLEGERVRNGQILAKLIDEDAKLDLQTARSDLRLREAELRTIESEIRIVRAEIDTLDKRIESAEARRDEIKDHAERLASIGVGGVSEQEIIQARLRLKTRETEIGALAVSRSELDARIAQLETRLDAARQQIESAETEVARRELSLARTEIRSPVDGVIQHLHASPGQKKLLQMDDPESATIAHLYEPGKLQARIDVPLEEAGGLFVGQPVRIRSAILPDRSFKGTVTRIAGQADLQRNTLQAKVRILEPETLLRPEMLCRAEFLAGGGNAATDTGGTGEQSGPVRIFVPPDALMDRTGSRAVAWKLTPDGRHIARTELELSDTTRDRFVRVMSGLNPGDRVVLNPPDDLTGGERVRPVAPEKPAE